MIKGNINGFILNLENWVTESLEENISIVSEQGDKEDWGELSTSYKAKITQDLRQYVKLLKAHTN